MKTFAAALLGAYAAAVDVSSIGHHGLGGHRGHIGGHGLGHRGLGHRGLGHRGLGHRGGLIGGPIGGPIACFCRQQGTNKHITTDNTSIFKIS